MASRNAFAGTSRALAVGILCVTSAACSNVGDPLAADAAPAADARPQPDASAPADAAAPDAQACLEGTERVTDGMTGHCYMLFTTPKKSWADAKTACEAIGAHLATASALAENQLFSGIAPDVAGSGEEDVWIGATDAATEGTFLWSNAETFGFTHWRSGEPNDSGDGAAGNKENCAIIEGDNAGTWDDRSCAVTFNYMCERD